MKADRVSMKYLFGALAVCVLVSALLSFWHRDNRAAQSPAPEVQARAGYDAGARTGVAPHTVAGSSPVQPSPVTKRTAHPSAANGIGSEGYGPHILKALSGEDASAAWSAFGWLRSCEFNAEIQAGMERFRADPKVPQDRLKLQLEMLQDEERKCQTVTPEMFALKPRLLLQAMSGKVLGAAGAYAGSLRGPLAAGEKVDLLAALRRDADEAEPEAIVWLASRGAEWGLSPVEGRVYELAAQAIRVPQQGLLDWFVKLQAAPPLPDDQEDRARAAAGVIAKKYQERLTQGNS